MTSMLIIEERVEIPLNLDTLTEFRRWATSDKFPETGRIDFISGRIEVDLSPEDFFCHGTLKGEIYAVLQQRAKRYNLGHVVTDSTRVSCPTADLSAEPDVVFISYESLDAGRLRLVPKTGKVDRYVEVEGPPDLVVEIVSDSSVQKDTERLPKAYSRAGVREYWLADARGDELIFHIYANSPSGYEPAETDRDGFQKSGVMACCFCLARRRDQRGHWQYDLHAK
jgi:Uma2 family endonuclease